MAWDFKCGMCDQQSFRSACAYAQSDQSLFWSLEYSKSVKLLTEQYLEFLSLTGGYTGLSESTLVKMPHCWKSHAAAHFCFVTLDHKIPLQTQGFSPNAVSSKRYKLSCVHRSLPSKVTCLWVAKDSTFLNQAED